jgi:DNA-binding response OmpR family regulator
MAHVIVVEDDRSIADLIALYLRKDGHEVEVFGDGVVAWREFDSSRSDFDIIVLDLMLPGLDGRGVARRVRMLSDTPIVMLTALDDDRDKLEGLGLGADDYVTKPFNPEELVARVRAILRRVARSSPQSSGDEEDIRCGNVRLDVLARRAYVDGVEVQLRAKEFDLIAQFAANLNIVLSREQLLAKIWNGEFDNDTRTVDVHISRLRERLAAANASVQIDTVRSVGYRMNAVT